MTEAERKVNHLLDIQVKDAAPHIFQRPILLIDSNTQMLQVATFLAIGPEIYVDGLLVIDDKVQRGKPIGRISSRHIISCILDCGYPDCMQKKASQMIDGLVMPLEMDSPLKRALEVFKTTGFAFVPILAKSEGMMERHSLRVAASLSIRDILPLIAKANLTIPVKEFASRLISLNSKNSIREVLDYMLNKGIRNIGIKRERPYQVRSGTIGGVERDKDAKLYRIINDRNILEFLLSHNGREVLYKKRIIRLADISFIDSLDATALTAVKSNTSISGAAELLMDVHNPFLIYESDENEVSIITPWDIVMKLLWSDDLAGKTRKFNQV
jgi:predicted transcriptional regulator